MSKRWNHSHAQEYKFIIECSSSEPSELDKLKRSSLAIIKGIYLSMKSVHICIQKSNLHFEIT